LGVASARRRAGTRESAAIPFPFSLLKEVRPLDWRLAVTVGLFVVLVCLWSQFELRAAEEQATPQEPDDTVRATGARPHFSPADGESTQQARQYFVALTCRAQRTAQVRLRAPSVARLVLTHLLRTFSRPLVRNAGRAGG